MCYAKPGPRCSNHTRKALNKAKKEYTTATTNNTPAPTHLQQQLSDAYHAYLSTPDGLKTLAAACENALNTNDNTKAESLHKKLTESLKTRLNQIRQYNHQNNTTLTARSLKTILKNNPKTYQLIQQNSPTIIATIHAKQTQTSPQNTPNKVKKKLAEAGYTVTTPETFPTQYHLGKNSEGLQLRDRRISTDKLTNKPSGAFWTATGTETPTGNLNTPWASHDAAQTLNSGAGTLTIHRIQPVSDAIILTIDTIEDQNRLFQQYWTPQTGIDWNRIKNDGIDAVHVTQRAVNESNLEYYNNLRNNMQKMLNHEEPLNPDTILAEQAKNARFTYWDVESTSWLNLNKITVEEKHDYIPPARDEDDYTSWDWDPDY